MQKTYYLLDSNPCLGLYGRLDGDKWFHTTITNVDPTAKQSWVLHPHVCLFFLKFHFTYLFVDRPVPRVDVF